MVYLEKADYLSEYKIKLTFNTGEVGIVDLSDIPATGKGQQWKTAS